MTERPERIDHLEEVPPAEQDLYLPDPDGAGFLLSAGLVEHHESFAAAKAERQAKIDRLDERIRTHDVDMALSRELGRHVDGALLGGAVALLRQRLRFEVEEGPDGEPVVSVAGHYGPVSLAFAIETWLEGDGAAFVARNRRRA